MKKVKITKKNISNTEFFEKECARIDREKIEKGELDLLEVISIRPWIVRRIKKNETNQKGKP